MATPADQRLLELLGRWLTSLELHTKYSSLDDDSYWKVQPWTEHQRPTRWIVDLAKQKTLALRAQVEQRAKAGDTQFSDSLELMAFLANLVGAEHIERFIPVAEASNEREITPSPPPDRASDSTIQQPSGITATREMPKFLGAKRAPPPQATAQVARTERRSPAPAKPAAPAPAKPAPAPAKPAPAPAKPAPKAQPKPPPRKTAPQPERTGPSEDARDQVIADAARLVQWGRKWFELPELIARMADRPSLPDVRRILKENKAAIEKKAGNS